MYVAGAVVTVDKTVVDAKTYDTVLQVPVVTKAYAKAKPPTVVVGDRSYVAVLVTVTVVLTTTILSV